jgi:hypothetical protein
MAEEDETISLAFSEASQGVLTTEKIQRFIRPVWPEIFPRSLF